MWSGGYGGNSYRKEFEASERELCEARWALRQVLKHVTDVLPESLWRVVTAQLEAHGRHRLGDRDHVLQRIDRRLEQLARDVEYIHKSGGIPGAALDQKRQTLMAERQRIAARTVEDLFDTYWGNEQRLHSELD